ncbi:hypothetical protein J2792_003380 [Novosphingobium capsulatum]|uniref:Uncharacterized protein n=1 Tax=Novosphingobium capsulatum TaxID=13688 RepID=A0ABU1MQ73_9SPHN|nr:hypothetical protein [Novosphingobium capsulatum]
MPDLARAVEAVTGLVDTLDLCLDLVIPAGTHRTPGPINPAM